ncbi:hypothetical protein FRC12_017507 [Ceratobasidium sp. 428]|nr:hypothetical protein FRC12_017507 [Ceratobasidium sp. 428]
MTSLSDHPKIDQSLDIHETSQTPDAVDNPTLQTGALNLSTTQDKSPVATSDDSESELEMPSVEECLELLEEAIFQDAQRTSEQQDERPNRFKTYEYEQVLLRMAVVQSSKTFEQSRKLKDLDVIIACVSKALQLLPEGHPNRPIWLDKLATSYLLSGSFISSDKYQ